LIILFLPDSKHFLSPSTVTQAVWVNYSLLRESYETMREQQRLVRIDSQSVSVRQVPLQGVGLFRIAEVRASSLTRRPVTLSHMTAFSTPCKLSVVPVRPRYGGL